MDLLTYFYELDETTVQVFQAVLRYLAPILAFILLLRTVKPLLTFKMEPEIWAWLCPGDGRRLAITHWENIIGSHKKSDVVIDLPTVEKSHAVLTRYDDGSWTISDADSRSGVFVNGERVEIASLEEKDVITIGDVDMVFLPMSKRQEGRLATLRTQAAFPVDSLANLFLLSILQLLCAVSYLMTGDGTYGAQIVMGFSGIMISSFESSSAFQ